MSHNVYQLKNIRCAGSDTRKMSHNVYLSAQSFAKPFLHNSMLCFSVTCLEGVGKTLSMMGWKSTKTG
jgi:hypothetical protein